MVTHNMGDMKYRMLYIDLKRLLEAGKYSEFRTEMEDALAEGYPIDGFYPDSEKKWEECPFLHRMLGKFCGVADEWNKVKDEYCKTIEFLLDRGANVNALDNNGWNALNHLCRYGVGILLPEDLFERIVLETEDLEHTGDYFPWFNAYFIPRDMKGYREWDPFDNTPLKCLVQNYIMGMDYVMSAGDEKERKGYDNIWILIKAGADTKALNENNWHEEDRKYLKELVELIDRRKEITSLQEQELNNVEYEYER